MSKFTKHTITTVLMVSILSTPWWWQVPAMRLLVVGAVLGVLVALLYMGMHYMMWGD